MCNRVVSVIKSRNKVISQVETYLKYLRQTVQEPYGSLSQKLNGQSADFIIINHMIKIIGIKS